MHPDLPNILAGLTLARNPIEMQKLMAYPQEVQPVIAQMLADKRAANVNLALERHPDLDPDAVTPIRHVPLVCEGKVKEFIARFPLKSIDLLITDVSDQYPPSDLDMKVTYWTQVILPRVKWTGWSYLFIRQEFWELYRYLYDIEHGGMELMNVLTLTVDRPDLFEPSRGYLCDSQLVFCARGKDAGPLNIEEPAEDTSLLKYGPVPGKRGKWMLPIPDELAERFVRHSTPPGGLVVDPFAVQDGVFLRAAVRAGRRAIGRAVDRENMLSAVAAGCYMPGPC